MRRAGGGHKITDVITYKNSKIRQVSGDDPGSSYNDERYWTVFSGKPPRSEVERYVTQ